MLGSQGWWSVRLVDMYLELPNIAGGSAAANHFQDMQQGIVKDGP